jgi:hypothetical protein
MLNLSRSSPALTGISTIIKIKPPPFLMRAIGEVKK